MTHSGPAEPQPLRIVSYNVRYFGHALRGLASTGRSMRGIGAQLASLVPAADVVCLQEVETRSLRSSVAHRAARRPALTQLQAFMSELAMAFARTGQLCPYEAFYFRAHSYRLGDLPIYTTGLAVLVNLDTLQVARHNVASPEHITHHHIATWKDHKQSRICAHLQLCDRSGHPLHIFNTHLSLPTPFAKGFWAVKEKMGFGPNQVHEARALAAFVKRHAGDEPFIVCGDFNSPPRSPVYQHLTQEAGWVCAQETLRQIDPARPRGFPTAGFMRWRMHLDHLFSSPRLRWLDAEGTRPFGDRASPFHGLSDHVPLIARMKVGG